MSNLNLKFTTKTINTSLASSPTIKPRQHQRLHVLLALTFCLLGFIGPRVANGQQRYGNEWISYGRTYFKIPIAQNGIYRIGKSTLDQAGIPTGTIGRGQYQIWRRGVEQAIFVTGTQPSVPFGTTDYIEFYAQKNDGGFDTSLYLRPEYQPHKLYNLHTDTAAYFLTWLPTGQQGKRMEQYAEDRISVPVTSWHREERLTLQTETYTKGKGHLDDLGAHIFHSWFDRGEGWVSAEITSSASGTATYTTVFSGLSAVSGFLTPTVEVVVVGRNGNQHRVQVLAGASTASLSHVDSLSWRGFDTQYLDGTVPIATITGGQLVVRVRVLSNSTTVIDRFSIAYVRLRYAQNLDLGNNTTDRTFVLPASGQDYYRLALINPPTGLRVYDVGRPNNVRLLRSLGAGLGQQLYAVDGAIAGTKVFANVQPFQLQALSLKRVNFRNINPQAHNYLIISSRALMRPAQGVANPVRAYADYRASAQGGRFDTLVVEQDLVINQFGFGDPSPLGTRHFLDFMLQGRAEYLLLIGKGRQVQDRFAADYQATNLVHTFGTPGSDVLLSAGLRGSGQEPALPTGRLSVLRPVDILTYLNKIKEHEALGFKDIWRKNTLVLTGGKLGETDGFKLYGQSYQTSLKGQLLGSDCKLITREDATTIIESINVAELVNKGLSLITIFGHSSPAGADIDIGNASEPGFNNQGKYPMIILNGCAAGNYFTTGSFVLADNWLYTPNRGAVMFLGNVDEGLASTLDAYMDQYLKIQFQDSAFFSKSAGVVQKELIKRYMRRGFVDAIDSILTDQFTMHGDPALLLFGAPKVDYKTSNAEVFLRDKNPSTASSTIRVGVVVSNLGRATSDSLTIRFRRVLSDGRTLNYFSEKLAPVYRLDTIFYELPKPDGNSGGTNSLIVTLNYYDLVDEITKSNNEGRLDFFLPESGLSTLFPPNYGIVGNATNLRLTAQSNNLLSAARDYYFECDTTIRFNSPIKLTAVVRDFNLARAPISLPVRQDSTVYYWRVKFNDVRAPSDTTWYNSSFTYVNGLQEGWSQRRFDQFTETTDLGVNKIYSSRSWDFPLNSLNLKIEAAGGNVKTGNSWLGSNVYLNGVNIFVGSDASFNCYPNFGSSGTIEDRLITLVLDKNTLQFKPAVRNPFSEQRELCGRRPFPFNFYNQTQTFLFVQMQNQILGANTNDPTKRWMDDGDIMVVLNSGDFAWERARQIGGSASYRFYMQGLSSIGIDTASFVARNLNGYPFIGVGRKRGPYGSARMIYANPQSAVPPRNQILTLDTTFSVRSATGTIQSPRIGPARQWQSVRYQFAKPAGSWFKLSLYGVSLQGQESLLVDSLIGSSPDISNIDAAQFPYIYLKATVTHPGNVPPQLKRWTVLYEGVPEGTLSAQLSGQSQLTIPEKQEGEKVNLKVVFQNISNKTFADTIGVRVRLRNAIGRQQYIKVPTLRALGPNDTGSVILKDISTIGWAGDNSLQVFFNPQYQAEQIYTNNSIEIPFKVKGDNINPLLDVTFDGVRIIDGDITSPTPAISVVLRDDNRFLPKQDTTGLLITLSKQGSTEPPTRVNFADGKARFTPATANTPLRIDYQPDALSDGIYTLRVQGEDASGNKSGLADYTINFKVLNESTVTNFYPYPNPFSSSTRFVFTLTGAEMPDDIKIQIMTVAGRVVREITKNELGPIRIGNNITTFAWNGTDEFGDKLANGVYLYRVILRKNGQPMDHRATDADNMFKNGIGKMYLMR